MDLDNQVKIIVHHLLIGWMTCVDIKMVSHDKCMHKCTCYISVSDIQGIRHILNH